MSNCLISEEIPVGEVGSTYSKLKASGRAELKVLNDPPILNRKLGSGSISTFSVERLILLKRLLAPTDTNDEEAMLRPNTSLVAVRLRPNCSISLRLPPEMIKRLFLSIKNLAEKPCLNFLSSKPLHKKEKKVEKGYFQYKKNNT